MKGAAESHLLQINKRNVDENVSLVGLKLQ